MLNFMCIQGYVKDAPVEFGTDEFKGCKFTLATKTLYFGNNNRNKYMYVNVVVFGEGRVKTVMSGVKESDMVTVLGKYNLAPYGKGKNTRYYPQLVLEELEKNFASGSVPSKDTIEAFELEKQDDPNESEMMW